MKRNFLLLAVVVYSAACSQTEPKITDEQKETKVYVTGSNLPKRDRSGVMVLSPDAIQNGRTTAPSAPKTGG
jgi:hypothetical protein